MDASLYRFLLVIGAFIALFVLFIFLSTCMGEPIRRAISSYWERLLEHADSQPPRLQRPFRGGQFARGLEMSTFSTSTQALNDEENTEKRYGNTRTR
ncbi:MAG: hypothetical protein CYPHOPRED_002880 [Cyphobasidiales sp. Tagirdzhanova-0007]|nr:MAG: hypothetical protein CYPHOPRED_002880 [Cyphobasidiales sp. Tagirdzhanova-0007]